jgi:C4-dicarboxylate transporter, DctM subunit
MIIFTISFFTLLLIIGVPISVSMLISTGISLLAFTDTSLLILPQQIFNGADNFVIFAVPFFIVAGSIMAAGKMASQIVQFMAALVGRLPGGLAIATIFACAFFSAISGSSLATIVAIGSIMVPALVKEGYPKRLSTGILTSAGALGVLIPPSIPMILLCVSMETPVGDQFLAGFIPGMLIVAVLSTYVYIVCKKNSYGVVNKKSFYEILMLAKESFFTLILPVIILGGIYSGFATPTEVGAIALVYALIIEMFIHKSIKFNQLTDILVEATILAAALTFIFCAAKTFTWFLTIENIPHQIAAMLITMFPSKWVFLFCLSLTFLVLGMFLELVSILIVIGPLLIPTLQHFNINLIHFGIIMIVNCEIGFMTPPFGVNLFVAMGIMEQDMVDIVKGVIPFMLLYLFCLILLILFPEISLSLLTIFK